MARCEKRFLASPSGRRSGKTEIAKRRLVRAAMTFSRHPDGRFIFSAPTHDQAREIAWEDLKLLVPRWATRGVSETKRTLRLFNGARIQVMGMDRPERAEGAPVDGIVLDEYANMRAEVWTRHVRPALSTPDRPGWAWFIGVPEGRNHYHALCETAKRDPAWGHFHWKTAEIDPEEAEAARNDLDLLTYLQEYEGAFVTFAGRAYYAFGDHCKGPARYDPSLPLVLCFDFNRNPGVAVAAQEQAQPAWLAARQPEASDVSTVTAAVWECYIEPDSNTDRVCERIAAAWGDVHTGEVLLHGDPAGGARTAQAVEGSDWDIIENRLRPVFGHRLRHRYADAHPRVRVRVNAMNTRFKAADGTIRFAVDPSTCPMLVRDLEGVTCDDAGEVEKVQGGPLTHLSDALGYYVAETHPCAGRRELTRVAV
jgi:hypothetical protein